MVFVGPAVPQTFNLGTLSMNVKKPLSNLVFSYKTLKCISFKT